MAPSSSLASILRVDRTPDGAFVARLEDFFGQSLAGDVMARALLAAADGTGALEPHALHASFLRPAPPGAPLRLEVERLDPSPDRATRLVRIGGDAPTARVAVAFGAQGDGPEWQDVAPPSPLPDPERLPSTFEQARTEGWTEYARGPIEFRRVTALRPDRGAGGPCAHVEWLRPREALPADPRVHAAALVFAAGFYGHWAFERRIGPGFAHDRYAAFDVSVAVHRPARFDDWWLLRDVATVGASGRALAQRQIFTRDGALAASVVQHAQVASA